MAHVSLSRLPRAVARRWQLRISRSCSNGGSYLATGARTSSSAALPAVGDDSPLVRTHPISGRGAFAAEAAAHVAEQGCVEPRSIRGASWDRVIPWERSSMLTPEQMMLGQFDTEEALELFIDDEIARFAPMAPRPLSMQEVLDMLKPERIAKFLHLEVPVRYAERLRWIEEIPDWEDVPELVEVHRRHKWAFRELRLVKRRPNLDKFTEVVLKIVQDQKTIQHDLAKIFNKLFHERGDAYGMNFADGWLDNFLLNCIGTETLMAQYLACVQLDGGTSLSEDCLLLDDEKAPTYPAGIIEPDCDVAQICRDAAEHVVEICERHTGKAPLVRVEVHTARDIPRFPYIPGFLKFILIEVLKNSCRATAELVKSDRELSKLPITIIVCGDDHQVVIRVMDRAKGIPFEVGPRVWSYLYSTTGKAETAESYGEHATEFAGYGVGLPLAKLYARYLGGSLDLVSLPGYGTTVDLFLTRLQSEQVEVVPDEDNG